MMVVLNGLNMTTRQAAHDEIARQMQLPEYYGRNLDALWDILTEREWTITFVNTRAMLEALGDYGEALFKTFFDAKTVVLRIMPEEASEK